LGQKPVGNLPFWSDHADVDRTAAYEDVFAALGAETRLRILRTLLAAHPGWNGGWGDSGELGIAPSTLSHHLEKLKNEDLIAMRGESTFLRYTANTPVLDGHQRCLNGSRTFG
jgi:DNA-binding transcriptional ArsR family regulator